MIDFTRPTAYPRARIWKSLAAIAFGLYLLLLSYFSLVPTVSSPAEVSDKFLHFIAYGGLTALAAAAWPRLALFWLLLCASAVGAILEIAQGVLNMGRTASFGDQFANMSGAALALLIWMCLLTIYKKFGQSRQAQKGSEV